jgi:hypothetical protein
MKGLQDFKTNTLGISFMLLPSFMLLHVCF